MRVHVGLEFLERTVQFAVALACLHRQVVPGAQFAHGLEGRARRIVVLHHHVHGIAHGLEERRLQLLLAFFRALEPCNVRKQDLLFFLHVRVHLVPHAEKLGCDFRQFRMIFPVLGPYLCEQRADARNHSPHILVVLFHDVLGQIRQACRSPVGFFRAPLSAVLLKPLQNLFGRYACMQAGVLQRFRAPAAIVDSGLFQNLFRRGIRCRNVPYFGRAREAHRCLP